MLISINDIVLIYEKILQNLNVEYISVVIYTSIDVDSLCSLKMLTKFFKSLSIHFNIYPVTTYTELQQKIQKSKQYQKVKLFMFINCGGYIDLTDKWFMQPKLQSQNQNHIILFDSNKPIYHKNLQNQKILVIDDGHADMQNRLTSQDVNKLQELNQFDLDQQINQNQIQQNDQNSDNNAQSPKRRAQIHITQQMRKHKQILQKKFQNYYAASFVSLPISHLLYRLIRQLHKADNYTLWFGIIGMTSMYLENSISREVFQTLTNFYRSDMVRFNLPNAEKKQKGQIFSRKGYHFPLMNHWSLYESMMNSPYLMIKLGLWNDKGITKLHQILTKIGISLDQSKQQYKYMPKQSKEQLQQKIFTIAEQYNLVEITYQSFMKQTDSSSAYMASDFYYIISAILEKPIGKTTAELQVQHRLNYFWDAYSILDGSQEMIKKTVQEFKQMSILMMREVKDIIQRDSIIQINKVNFSNIRCDTKEKRLFQHPSVLTRLAYMLMGIQKQRKQVNSKTSTMIPCVVSLQDIDKNLCLLVGVVSDQKSKMGTIFNQVSTRMGIQVMHDRFMSNIIVVHKDNLIEFIKQVGKPNKDKDINI